MSTDVQIDAQRLIDRQAAAMGQLHTQLIMAQETIEVLQQRLADATGNSKPREQP